MSCSRKYNLGGGYEFNRGFRFGLGAVAQLRFAQLRFRGAHRALKAARFPG